MDYKKLRKLLSQVIISGETKSGFFKKSKKFEMQVYYTPVKNKILIINIDGCEFNDSGLCAKFRLGDDVQLVYEWVDKYGHEIIFERNRLQN